MFSQTRYAMNDGLRVAYRASQEDERDIVFVSNWFGRRCGSASRAVRGHASVSYQRSS
ncbi:hypothetical protein [Mycobacterium sp. 852002-51971_SCH5477799-a]|uniref:hypothetical protein n=1 Tax=Mycobacterium sp. 852002-51971_SCH5477799-a TaxID=1834106 RepID=UPI000A824782|nr:hypothetical protein [Mycobacterium sp. 852002-51971_SCH5477799-a]